MATETRSLCSDGGTDETEWNVGTATRAITPEQSMRMSGFANRTEKSDGKLSDIYAKAIAFEDDNGGRAVVLNAEILFIARNLRKEVAERVEQDYGIDPSNLVLNASHTHFGPEIREMRYVIYGFGDEEIELSDTYRERLGDDIVEVIGESLDALEPTELRYGHARCGIGMSRRLPTEDGVRFKQAPDGPVDHDVPVLAAYRGDEPHAILFGYACHPTCLSASVIKYTGDWAGKAMANLEEYYDDTTAIFLQGCGGDIKAYPQNTHEVSNQHGQALSNSVRAALDAETKAVHGPLRSVYEEISLEFEDAPSKEDLEADLESDHKYTRRHARLLLDQIDEHGAVPTEHPYPMQALGFGDDLTMITMAGEVLAEYSLTLKDRLEGDVWPMGYTNGDFTYVPTARAAYEGGYEGGGAITYTSYPGPLKPQLEDDIVGTALALAERVGVRQANRRQ